MWLRILEEYCAPLASAAHYCLGPKAHDARQSDVRRNFSKPLIVVRVPNNLAVPAITASLCQLQCLLHAMDLPDLGKIV